MFDSGPTGTRMISSVAARYVSIRNSTAPVDSFVDVDGGMSRYPPWTALLLWMSPRGIGKSSRWIGFGNALVDRHVNLDVVEDA